MKLLFTIFDDFSCLFDYQTSLLKLYFFEGARRIQINLCVREEFLSIPRVCQEYVQAVCSISDVNYKLNVFRVKCNLKINL